MKKKLIVLLLVASVLGVSALGGAENASAQSVPKTNTLSTISADGQHNYNIGDDQDLSWIDIIRNTDNVADNFCNNPYNGYYDTVCASVRASLIQNLDNGTYPISVSQLEYYGVANNFWQLMPEARTIQIKFSLNNNPSPVNIWNSMDSAYLDIGLTGEYNLEFGVGYDGEYRFRAAHHPGGGSGNNYNFVAGLEQYTFGYNYYVKNYSEVIYDDFWEGSTVDEDNFNSGPPIATPTSDWTPDWYVSVGKDWKAAIHDQNFNTFDPNPFLCDGEFAPILNYEIWDVSDEPHVKLFDAYNSATVQIDYQFNKMPVDKTYRIVGWYSGCEDMQFSKSSFKDFKINKNGDLYTPGLSTCITETIPWVDFNACIVGVNDLLALLSFNMMNPENPAIVQAANANPNACYTMGELDNWLHTQGQQMCPAFSSHVRNIVTPFITFILGGVVFYWVTRGKSVVI